MGPLVSGFFLLSTMVSRFIYVAVWVSPAFLLIARRCNIVWVDPYIVFIHSPIEGHLSNCVVFLKVSHLAIPDK